MEWKLRDGITLQWLAARNLGITRTIQQSKRGFQCLNKHCLNKYYFGHRHSYIHIMQTVSHAMMRWSQGRLQSFHQNIF